MRTTRTDRIDSNRDLTYSWWLVGLLLIGFAVLAAVTVGSNTLGIDLDISLWTQKRGSWAEPLSTFGNVLGEAPFAIGLLVVALILATARRMGRVAWYLLLAATGRLLASVLKGLFESPRPTDSQVSLAEHFSNFGFPSGHATTSAISLGSLAFLIAVVVPDSRIRWASIAIAVLGIGCTAFARIYTGAHWFTDTMGGMSIGVAIVLVAANLSAAIVNWRRQRGTP